LNPHIQVTIYALVLLLHLLIAHVIKKCDSTLTCALPCIAINLIVSDVSSAQST